MWLRQGEPGPEAAALPPGPRANDRLASGVVYNAVADLAAALGPEHVGEHVRTLRRQFFNRPGKLCETPEALIVYLDPFRGQDELLPVIDALKAGTHRVPWLDNRRLVMSLTPRGEARSGP